MPLGRISTRKIPTHQPLPLWKIPTQKITTQKILTSNIPASLIVFLHLTLGFKKFKNMVGIFQVEIFQGVFTREEFDCWKFSGWEFNQYRRKYMPRIFKCTYIDDTDVQVKVEVLKVI